MIAPEEVRGALTGIEDPCSKVLGRPISIVDLGLIGGVRVEGEAIELDLVTTVPNCIMFCDIAAQAKEAIGERWPEASVEVKLDVSTPWSEERMEDGARERMRAARKATVTAR